jgi:hypothetical protein
MKKLSLLIVAVVAFASVASAQGKWEVGGRVGSGFQAVGQYHLSDKNYVEARFGMSWCDSYTGNYYGYRITGGLGLTADFSALYMWRILTPNWTPGSGTWFFDAGVGLNIGGRANAVYLGAQGVAKLGYTFEGLPLSLAFDWAPTFGASILYGSYMGTSLGTSAGFDAMGLADFGITCSYRF